MRKFIILLVVFALIACMYYLLIHPFEFTVKFRARTVPGDLIETIRIWDRSLDSSNIVEVDSFNTLTQRLTSNDRTYVYKWNFTMDDSTTNVNVQISEPGSQLMNKLLVPFAEPPIEVAADRLLHDFHNVLNEHLRITRVEIIGDSVMDSAFCVCSTLKTAQFDKAKGMMRDYLPLTSFITTFNLKTNGFPIVKVLEWNHSSGTLKYDFCFPIVNRDSLPDVRQFQYKFVRAETALKAHYYGNYITSDRAWYELLHYAEEHGYTLNGLPVEHFYNNPSTGMNEREWRADIYLPVKR